jgi:hypothetical protein
MSDLIANHAVPHGRSIRSHTQKDHPHTTNKKSLQSHHQDERQEIELGIDMSTTPTSIQYTKSAPDLLQSSSSSSPPLSRSSTFTRTIPLEDKTIHVVRNPTEGYRLKDVEWVIHGSREHVCYYNLLSDRSLSTFENRQIH